MKANELRIGNWICFSNKIQPDKYIQVNARFFTSLAGGRNMNDVKNDEEINGYYQPIPLTPEILEKCGFVEKGDWFYRQHFMLGFITTEDNLQTEIKFAGVEEDWKLLNINYLHQLQNLYYALTGEELEVNLNPAIHL